MVYCKTQVAFESNPANARGESALAINPLNGMSRVGASRSFTNPRTYEFSLAVYATFTTMVVRGSKRYL